MLNCCRALELVFVAVYQKALILMYVDRLLERHEGRICPAV